MGRARCIWKAIKDWLRYGVWVRHIYEIEKNYRANVIYDDKHFRVSYSLNHKPGEKVEQGAYIQECRCIMCGHKDTSWYSKERYERMMSEL